MVLFPHDVRIRDVVRHDDVDELVHVRIQNRDGSVLHLQHWSELRVHNSICISLITVLTARITSTDRIWAVDPCGRSRYRVGCAWVCTRGR